VRIYSVIPAGGGLFYKFAFYILMFMSRLPKITVVTPSYNQGEFIEQTIVSVLEQQYPHLEYFIFDGGSSDRSPEIIRKYEKYLAGWASEKDRGQSDAINKGFRRATGELLHWLNSDDLYAPGALTKVGRAFAAAQERGVTAPVVYGKVQSFDENGPVGSPISTDVYPSAAKTLGWARIDQPGIFFPKAAYDAVGLLNPAAHFCMDMEWWMRYLLRFGVANLVFLDEVLAQFRLHGASKTVSQKNLFSRDRHAVFVALARAAGFENYAREFLTYRDAPEFTFSLPPGTRIECIEPALNYFLMLLGMEYYEALDTKTARRALAKVKENVLEHDDRKLLSMYRQRALLPTGWIRLIRRLTRRGRHP
jgi:glycosyltransferase involved in cell wall biosynthesis